MPEQSDSNISTGTGDVNDVIVRRAASRIDRRGFLKLVGGALGGFVFVNRGGAPSAAATPITPPQYFCLVPNADISVLNKVTTESIVAKYLARFVDPLPIPQIIQPSGTYQGMPLYEVSMRQFTQKLHRDLPPTTLWGYNALRPLDERTTAAAFIQA